jgi:tetratricopeptide (TPR) repeat protein
MVHSPEEHPEKRGPEAFPSLSRLAPGTVLSHYRIVEHIGAGGMGVVYKAEDTELCRTVALKFLTAPALGSEEDRTRLVREAQAAAALDHPNICTVHEIARADGYTFIVMALIEGESLADLIAAGPLDVEKALDLTVQVARGLKAAHDRGIVHRDIKPANIMITRDGTAKIMDFGIAKAAGRTGLTGPGATLGTIAYMSPEQTEGDEVDGRSDIWSLGVVLYQMLTGSLPFRGAYDQAVIYSILSEEPKPISDLRPDVPGWLQAVVTRALAKRRDSRYQDLGELLTDIEARKARPRRQVSLRSLLAVLALVTAGIVATVLLTRKPEIVKKPERTFLAVLPFENMTGEAGLDWMVSGIPDNLTADLAQSRFFRVMTPERLRQVIDDIGLDMTGGEGTLGTAETIDLLARATDLDAVAVGSFIKAGGKIRITMKIESPRTKEVIGSTIMDDSEDRLLDLIDQLSAETKRIFNLTRAEIDRDLDEGAGLKRTRSVKAASDFSKGLEYSYNGAFLEAAEAFAAAIQADPDFAMAYAKASEAYKNLGYDDKAESLSLIAVDKAVELTDRVPPADRTFILANHADLISSPDQAIASYRDLIQAYPDDPEGYYKLGLIYESISEWDAALEYLGRALELDPKFGPARFELATILIRQDDLEPALAELDRLLAYYRSIGNREGEATVLNAIGIVHRHRNEFDEAIACFETSIRIKEDLGDKRGVAASLGNLGLVYKTVGKTDSALAVLERSLTIKREIGDKVGISTALNKIAQIYELRGRFEEALGYYERSYEIREELGAKNLMASTLSDMAAVAYASSGEYDKAFRMDSTALALRQVIGDQTGEAQSLAHIAAGFEGMGRLEEAADYLDRSVTIGRNLADTRLLASLEFQAGRLYVARGRIDSALALYGKALRTSEDLDIQPWIATILVGRGSAYRLKGEYTLALADLARARSVCETVGDRFQTVSALLSMQELFREIGYWRGCDSTLAELDSYAGRGLSYDQRWEVDFEKARSFQARGDPAKALELGISILAYAKRPESRIEARLLLGEAALALEKAAAGEMPETGSRAPGPSGAARGVSPEVDALTELAAAVEEARACSYRALEAEGLRPMAYALMSRGRSGEAVRSAEQARVLAENLGLDDFEYLVGCGEALMAAGRREDALPLYLSALDRAADVQSGKCPPELRLSYLERKRIRTLIDLVGDLSARTGGSGALPDYEARFGLN